MGARMSTNKFHTKPSLIGLAWIITIALSACGTTPQQSSAQESLAATGVSKISSVTSAIGSAVAPTINGTPMTTLILGDSYTFSPTASDENGHILAFSITNKPSWAIFNTETGQLTGTPTTTGNYTNIIISVSNGTTTTSLTAFSITVQPNAGNAVLSWTIPTLNTDGSTLSDLVGYVIYYGTSSNTNELTNSITVPDGRTTTATIDGLTAGTTYYFAIASVSADGGEGNKSIPASKTI